MKGSPIIPVRIPNPLLEQIDREVDRSQTHRRIGAHTRSSFIIEAIADKLAKIERSRKWRKRKTTKPPA